MGHVGVGWGGPCRGGVGGSCKGGVGHGWGGVGHVGVGWGVGWGGVGCVMQGWGGVGRSYRGQVGWVM